MTARMTARLRIYENRRQKLIKTRLLRLQLDRELFRSDHVIAEFQPEPASSLLVWLSNMHKQGKELEVKADFFSHVDDTAFRYRSRAIIESIDMWGTFNGLLTSMQLKLVCVGAVRTKFWKR